MISEPICLRVKGPFACFTRPEFHVERVSYRRDVPERRVPFPAFNATHVSSVHMSPIGQVFLR